MSLTLGILIFVLLVAGVSATRKLLVFELTGTSSLIFGTGRPGRLFYAIFTLPGTILHELSHWLMAELLRVPTGTITILPTQESNDKGEERLGSVMTARSDPFRGFLIGIAPFVTGIISLLVLASLLTSFWGNSPAWQIALVLYGMLVIGNSFLISREDRRYWPIIGIIFTLVAVSVTQSGLTISSSAISSLTIALTQINYVLGIAVVLNLVLLGALFAVRYSIQIITGKKIVSKRRQYL